MKHFLARAKTCCLLFFCAISVCFIAGCATQSEDSDLVDKSLGKKPSEELKSILAYFPAGSIDSIARANQAIEVVKVEKKNIDARLFNNKLVCNKKFLVYDCYEEAIAQRKADLFYLQMLHTEAKRYIRSANVRERDYAIDRRAIKEQGTAEQRAANVKRHEALVKRVQERQAKMAAAARGETATPNAKHSGNYMTPQEKSQNVEDFEFKQEDYESHQQRVERKKARTQKKREEREAEKKAEAIRKQKQEQ